jgi:predicted RNA methylase
LTPLPGAAGKAATDKTFTTYDIQLCLYDARRVQYFRDAIRRTVRAGDVVVDAGSGTGLLGLFAAQAGAARVYCLELNPEYIAVIEQNARRNGLGERIVALNVDATRCDLPEPVDVLISEVISAGFFYEPQLQIINNLRRFLKPGGAIVPMAMKNYIELISAQEELYGLTFNFDARFTELDGDRSLTGSALYLATEFQDLLDPAIISRVRVVTTDSGTANAVKVTYDIRFADGVCADKPTDFLLNPQIIFLPEPVSLLVDNAYDIALRYHAGGSPLTCDIAVTPVATGSAHRPAAG